MNTLSLQCNTCNNEKIDFVDNLIFDVVLSNERIVIPNLTGFRCSSCGKTVFSTNSLKIVDKYVDGRVKGGYEVKISSVGGGKIGIYFPRNILRVMKVDKGKKAVLTPLSKQKMILEILD